MSKVFREWIENVDEDSNEYKNSLLNKSMMNLCIIT